MTELHEAVNQLYKILDSKLKEYQERKEYRTMKNNQIANAVKSQIIDYFTNTIDSETLIDRAIVPISDVSGIKRVQITELLEDAHGEFTHWLNDGGEELTFAEIRRLEAEIDNKYSLKIQNLFI